MIEFSMMNISMALPEIILIAVSLFLLVLGAIKGNEFAQKQMLLAQVTLVATIFVSFTTSPDLSLSFGGMFLSNGFTIFAKILVLFGALCSLYLASAYYKDKKNGLICEFPVLILLSVAGMLMMISANNLLSLYMGLELQSLALYILAALDRDSEKSSEAGLKYFVLGALTSGIILYGCSLIYGFSGTIEFDSLRALYIADSNLPIAVLVGLIFVIIGICFKISAVPFHMWTPDVYQGSPTPVTAFFAIAPKIAAVALFIRFVAHPFGSLVDQWQQVIIFISAASMLVGSLGALRQTNIKRLIAYSSIGHIGFILVGLAAASQDGVEAILLYLMIYLTLTIGIFASIMIIKRKGGNSEEISALSGLAKSNPMLAMIIAIIMLSMAGIPPFAGFFAKFFVFLAAIEEGLYILAVIGMVSSVIAAFYYLRIIKIMYFDEVSVSLDDNYKSGLKVMAFAAAVINLMFFVFITPIVEFANEAAKYLF